MYRIVRKRQLNEETCLVEFEAEDLSRAARPGNFVILRVDEKGERFPLTIYDKSVERGTLTVVCQAVGVSTRKLCALKEGDSIRDAAGPMGNAADISRIGKVICVGGGVGTAEAFPIAKAMAEKGNDVTVIIGARKKSLVICEKDIRKFTSQVYVSTDDGSYGKKGLVTDVLRGLLERDNYDLVYAIGPVAMMKAVAELTRPSGTKTLVSLNSIMIDGTGMCGCCRFRYEGKPLFTCVDGPEFDGHKVDFEGLFHRQRRYKDKEARALEEYDHQCRIGLDK